MTVGRLRAFHTSSYNLQLDSLRIYCTVRAYGRICISGDEIANVNFLYDIRVHALHNTIDSCIDPATGRRCYVLERRFTKFSERPLRRSRSFKVTDFATNRKLIYDFLLVIITKLAHILHRF